MTSTCAVRAVEAALGLAIVAGPLTAEPCTLYKPHNIATAKANIERYGWAQRLLAGYQSRVSYAMGKERAWLEAMVPELTPWPEYGQSCPVCVGKQSAMGETGLWNWSLDDPDQVTCKYCKTVFPHADYPETGSITAQRMGQTFTFYLTAEERAHPEETTGKGAYRWASWPVHTSWTGVIRDRKASWIAAQILPMAKVYALTGETAYAEHAAWCLDAIARAYPHWLYHSYNGVYADLPPGEAAAEMGRHPRAGKFPKGTIVSAFTNLPDPDGDGFEQLNNGFWGAGRMDAGVSGEGMMVLNCTVAYDLIRDATLDDGTPVFTPEARRRVEDDLLLAGCADLENYAEINNKCGPGRALSGAVGILFGRPEHLRRALAGFEALLDEAFHFDGLCRESPSYSGMHLGLMQDIPDILYGYSDPPGYQPNEGPRYDHLDPFETVPRYRLALESMVRMLAPNRRFPVIGDTHYTSGLSSIYAEVLAARYGDAYAGLLETAQGKPLAEAGSEYALWNRKPDLAAQAGNGGLPLHSEWFPGWHVAVLRGGLGADSPTALYLNGYEMHGHRHHDTLGLIYYDFGKELASDRGYIWDDPRNAWTRSTLSHNLVTVDGDNQVGANRRSTLELFGLGPGVEMIEATANAYQQCSEYRRTSALLRVDEQQTYALDVFRVTGGKLHQYGLNCNGKLLGLDGATPTPVAGKISYLENLRETRPAPAGWTATWQDGDHKLALKLLSDADRLILADAPGWRSYKGDELHAPPIQQVLVERSGDDLTSTYVALMVPYQGETCPVARAELLQSDPGTVAVRVELAGRTDYLVSALDETPHTYGPLTVAGRFAFVSLDAGGKVTSAWLLSGTKLSVDGTDLSAGAARTERKVTGIDGRTITLDSPLPAEAAHPGAYLLAGGTGFELESVEGAKVTVRDYPVPQVETVTLLHHARLTR